MGGARRHARSHGEARELADRLEQEGFAVERRWRYLIVGTASKEEAEALAAPLHGEVEPGGELVWETVPGNPFAVFGGLGGSGRRRLIGVVDAPGAGGMLRTAQLAQGNQRARHLSRFCSTNDVLRTCRKPTQPTILSEAADPLAAAAYRAEAWAGEPFLHEGEDPAQVLAPGTARRRALDDAIAEIEAGRREPTRRGRCATA